MAHEMNIKLYLLTHVMYDLARAQSQPNSARKIVSCIHLRSYGTFKPLCRFVTSN